MAGLRSRHHTDLRRDESKAMVARGPIMPDTLEALSYNGATT